MRLPRRVLPVASLLLASCVTINIYFPAAAAEKAADKIIDEVWQLKQGGATAPDRQPDPVPAQPAGEGAK